MKLEDHMIHSGASLRKAKAHIDEEYLVLEQDRKDITGALHAAIFGTIADLQLFKDMTWTTSGLEWTRKETPAGWEDAQLELWYYGNSPRFSSSKEEADELAELVMIPEVAVTREWDGMVHYIIESKLYGVRLIWWKHRDDYRGQLVFTDETKLVETTKALGLNVAYDIFDVERLNQSIKKANGYLTKLVRRSDWYHELAIKYNK